MIIKRIQNVIKLLINLSIKKKEKKVFKKIEILILEILLKKSLKILILY
jgi:hypothetical protein